MFGKIVDIAFLLGGVLTSTVAIVGLAREKQVRAGKKAQLINGITLAVGLGSIVIGIIDWLYGPLSLFLWISLLAMYLAASVWMGRIVRSESGD